MATVEVAAGDPEAINAAALAHDQLADTFNAHSSLITAVAGQLAPVWEGESATQFQDVQAEVVHYFLGAGRNAKDAGAALWTFGQKLDEAQTAGRRAAAQAAHWEAEVEYWEAMLVVAQQAEAAAQSAVTTAAGLVTTLTHVQAPSGADAATAMQSATTALNQDNGALNDARAQVAHVKRMLDEAKQMLVSWQKKGEEALLDAELAATVATGHLNALTIAPPPWIGGTAILDKVNLGAGGLASLATIGTTPLTVKAALELAKAIQASGASDSEIAELLGAAARAYRLGELTKPELELWTRVALLEKSGADTDLAGARSLLAKLGIENDNAGRALAALSILADLGTLWKPDGTGAWKDINRGAAAANLAATVSVLIDADATVAGIPGVGQVIVLASGAYLTVDWLIHNWGSVENVVKGLADDAGKAVDYLWNQFQQSPEYQAASKVIGAVFSSPTPHPVCQPDPGPGRTSQLPTPNSPTPGHQKPVCAA